MYGVKIRGVLAPYALECGSFPLFHLPEGTQVLREADVLGVPVYFLKVANSRSLVSVGREGQKRRHPTEKKKSALYDNLWDEVRQLLVSSGK